MDKDILKQFFHVYLIIFFILGFFISFFFGVYKGSTATILIDEIPYKPVYHEIENSDYVQ